jgi:uncharacterized membrane protein YidH (DUF202 family)
VPTGFVQTWHSASKTQADNTVILITTFTIITAEIIMIGAYFHFHHFFRSFIDSKRQRYYYYFWAAQALVVAILFVFLPIYLSERQHNIVIVPFIYLISIVVDFWFAVCVCFYLACCSQGGLLPVPLSTCCLCHCCTCCAEAVTNNTVRCLQNPTCGLTCHILSKDKQYKSDSVDDERTLCSYIYQFLMNLVCHTLTFFLISYVVQSLPNVLIAYYAYPTRALIRLSFIQISLVCLLLSVATLIDLFETLSWQCYICCYKKAPKETEQFDSVKAIEEQSNPRNIQTTEVQDGDDDMVILDMNQDEAEPHNKTSIVLKKPKRSICITIARIGALLTILGVLSIVLVVIGTIVFKQTEDKDTLKGLLTILPTILGNVIIYITKNKLLHPKDLKIELKQD